jgi:hypothetical protein
MFLFIFWWLFNGSVTKVILLKGKMGSESGAFPPLECHWRVLKLSQTISEYLKNIAYLQTSQSMITKFQAIFIFIFSTFSLVKI